MQRTRLVLFLLFFLQLPGPAQQPVLYFEKITTQNKLSHNRVNCIIQDKRGFMWIGTNDGLNRYDGNNFIVFRNQPGNKASLSGNIITDIMEDSDGVLWITTEDGGLTKYDYRLSPKNQFTQYKHLPGDSSSMPVNILNAIEEDKHGYLWLGTSGYSVIRFNKRTEKFDRQIPEKSRRTILGLCMDQNGWIWVGRMGGGLMKINTSDLSTVSDSRYDDVYAKLPHMVVTSLYRDRENNIWFGSWDKVLYKYNTITGRETIFPSAGNTSAALNDEILSFAADNKKRIWMGGRYAGLHIYDSTTQTFLHYIHNPLQEGSIADNTINCVYIDRSGKVWLGTNKGISVSSPSREQFVQQFLPRTAAGNDITIYDFYKDESGTLWIGTSEGIFLKSNKSSVYVHKPVQFAGNKLAVTKFYRDGSGQFYIGTNYSLFRYNMTAHTISLLPNTEKDTVMNKIIESRVVSVQEHVIDNKPVLMVSPYGHYLAYYDIADQVWVSRLDTKKKIIERLNLKDNLVHKIYKTSRGQLWFANAREGLGKWETIPSPHIRFFQNDPRTNTGLGNNHVYDLAEDAKGNLWISTFGGGLHYMDIRSETIRYIAETNNLLEGIQTDRAGTVWMVSNGNLYRYDERTASHTSFSLPDLEKSGGVSGYMYKDDKGNLYAAGKNYYITFHPDSVKENRQQPEVYLTDFRIFNESFSNFLFKKTIRLNYRQNYFTIEFAAPDYFSPQPVQYAYMLEGNDKDWVECGTRNFAPYSNLREGTYTFRVKATNNPGSWSEKEYQVKIVIIPPVWRRWWFFVLCALLISGAVYAVYRYRINELLKRQAIRNKIAQDLHDNVGSTLSSISVYSQVAHIQNEGGSKEELNEILDKISHTSTDMISEMNDIVWAINPRNDSIEKIIQRMESFAKPLLAARNISFSFNYDKTLFAVNLEMEKRKNFYLIFKEAVTNAIKYSGASALHVDIAVKHHRLELLVKDNGVGFNVEKTLSGPSQSLSGNGLRNMQVRAKEMGGSLSFTSRAGEGTEVRLTCPIP